MLLYSLLDLDNLCSKKLFIAMMLIVLFALLFLHHNVTVPLQNTASNVSIIACLLEYLNNVNLFFKGGHKF